MTTLVSAKVEAVGALILLALILAYAPAADKTYGDMPKAILGRVKDGDTFTVTVPSWPAIIGEDIPVRVRGVNTPEMNGRDRKLAIKAKEFTYEKLWQADKVTLRNLSRDNFFRIDADVWIDDKLLKDLLIEAGLGRPYKRE